MAEEPKAEVTVHTSVQMVPQTVKRPIRVGYV